MSSTAVSAGEPAGRQAGSMGVSPMRRPGSKHGNDHGRDARETHGQDAHATHGRDGHATRPAGHATGLTLIELLVAVGLLAMMILAFGRVIAESRKLVSISQSTQRSNIQVMALEQSLRYDIRCATKAGFLCLATKTLGDGRQVPVLFCTTVGPASSMTNVDPAMNAYSCSNGRIVGYGLASPGDTNSYVLWRSAWLLRPENQASAGDLAFGFDLSDFQSWPRASLGSFVNTGLVASNAPNTLTWPLNVDINATSLGSMWQYLATNLTEMTIAWTDGSPNISGNTRMGVNWYGVKSGTTATVAARDSGWSTHDITAPVGDPKYVAPNGCEYAAGGLYYALWTKENQTIWPMAIKFSFVIKDPQMPAEFRNGLPYEIVIPVDR